ncbi:cell division protein ZapA [Candidatus Latescibacterota bacterium]
MSESQPDRVTVEIFGKRYTLACEGEGEARQVRDAAQLVDEKMHQIADEQHPPTPLQTAILAALNLVDELRKLRSDYEAAETDIAERTSRLSSSLGQLLEQADELRDARDSAPRNRLFDLSPEPTTPESEAK